MCSLTYISLRTSGCPVYTLCILFLCLLLRGFLITAWLQCVIATPPCNHQKRQNYVRIISGQVSYDSRNEISMKQWRWLLPPPDKQVCSFGIILASDVFAFISFGVNRIEQDTLVNCYCWPPMIFFSSSKDHNPCFTDREQNHIDTFINKMSQPRVIHTISSHIVIQL